MLQIMQIDKTSKHSHTSTPQISTIKISIIGLNFKGKYVKPQKIKMQLSKKLYNITHTPSSFYNTHRKNKCRITRD